MVNDFASWRLSSENEPPSDNAPLNAEILNLKFFSDSDSAVIVLSTGDLYNAHGNGSVELCGSFEQIIYDAAWSPDEEILAVVTATSVIYLSRGFDPIADTPIEIKDLSFSKHVSVGWGKAETQFQGKGAKALRDPTMPIKVDSGIIDDHDDRSMTLSWRGDGEFLSVSSVDNVSESLSKRTIRVYGRNGALVNVSEPVDTMEGTIAWRPSGNVIASVQRKSPNNRDSPDLIFFERNGLRRYEFSLRIAATEPVRQLAWNADSNILAVLLQDRIQLWMTKNYYWYLKQEIVPRAPGSVPEWIQWHPEKPYTVFIGYRYQSQHTIETHTFLAGLICGPLVSPNDLGTTVSVDGTTVKVTPLAISNTPPPMAFREFELPSNAIHVAVNSSNTQFACLTSQSVVIAKWDPFTKPVSAPVIVASVGLDSLLPDGVAPKQIAYSQEQIAVAGDDENKSVVTVFSLHISDDMALPNVIATHEISPDLFILKSQLDQMAFVLETIDGSVHKLIDDQLAQLGTFPRLCIDFQVVPHSEDEYNIYGLSDNGRLYANERQLANSVTSMQVTADHCLFTTAQHYLKFSHLQADVNSITVPADDSEHDERCRSIERGSLLVCTLPSRTSVILQAPRGNLETTYPRILVLSEVRRHIIDKRYDLAFGLCRIHRIDLNLLHDYASEQFFDNLSLFVKQLNTVEYIDLFLSELKEEDVSRTLYKSTLDESMGDSIHNNIRQLAIDNKPISKTNEICDGILSVLTRPSHKEKYQQSILTAHACKSPPALEAALKIVAQFLTDQPKAERGIQHLCFLQDTELLYTTALGMYDLDLALLVAQHSQKDPKEYLPFLRNLQQQEMWRRKFLIDDHLKRYGKALVALDKLGETAFAELQDYVVQHELYQKALSLFKYSPEKQDRVLLLYAEHLRQQNKYLESGLTFESLGKFSQALESYLLGVHWKQALAVVQNEEFKSSDEYTAQIDGLYARLAAQTLDRRQYQEAATIFLEYLHDVDEAVRSYSKGSYFDDAIRIAILHNKPELLTSMVDSGLIEGFGYISELLSDCKRQIKSQLVRLRGLRLKKETDPIGFFRGPNDSETPDNVSLAPTESSTAAPSFLTQYTGKTVTTAKTGASRRTAKNRRREERKRARGKKGSIYEEEYLINSMGRLIERLDQIEPEATRLIEGLIRRKMRSHAFQIQRSFVDVREDLKAIVREVFTVSEKDRERYDEEGNVYYLPENPIPEIKGFAKFATLDFLLDDE